MRIDVVTLFPPMLEPFMRLGIVGRAAASGQVTFGLWNPRDFAHDRHRSVDDRPYGGGPGMVMLAEPLHDALAAARAAGPEGRRARVIHLSPQGRRLDHAGVLRLSGEPWMILIAGRYEGIDERLIDQEVDEECSIGDYVLSGGEPAAVVLIDAVVRQLPGVLGDSESAGQDSFATGLLDCGHYTRPREYRGAPVPEVLLSGDHDRVRRWRLKQSLGRTWLRRPDLLAGLVLDAEQQRLLAEFQREFRTGVDDEQAVTTN